MSYNFKASQDVDNCISEAIDSISELSNKYLKDIKVKFNIVFDLSSRVGCDDKPITDEELEQVLMELPLELFDISERISQYKTSIQYLKLKNKSVEISTKEENMMLDTPLSAAEMKCVVDNAKMENDISILVLNHVVDVIEHYISFSRELIMSAKKIWTARRDTETVNPIVENDYTADLPVIDKQSYIK